MYMLVFSLILLYLLGYIVSYLTIRHDFMKIKWTISDRITAICLSTGSWLFLLLSLGFAVIEKYIDNNKPAKW